MTRYLIAAVAVLTCLLGASAWLHKRQADDTAAVRAALAQSLRQQRNLESLRAREAKLLADARNAARALEASRSAERARSQAALRLAPEWAATPVPGPILEVINETDSSGRAPGDGLRDGPAGAPGDGATGGAAAGLPGAAPEREDERGPAAVGPEYAQ